MSKHTPTDHDILDAISQRWSPRAFSNKAIADADLNKLFEAARWAPSGFNLQPWRFIVCKQGTPAFDKLISVLMEMNQTWAKKAPVVVLAVSQTTLVGDGTKPTKPNGYAQYDLGQAVANLASQATSMGIYVHQMAGFSKDKADEVFEIPENFNSVVTFAMGYLGEAADLPEVLAEREALPRVRKPLSEIVFDGSWGNN